MSTAGVSPSAWVWGLLRPGLLVVASLEAYSDEAELEVGFDVRYLTERSWADSRSSVVIPWMADRWDGLVDEGEVRWIGGGARIPISEFELTINVTCGVAGAGVTAAHLVQEFVSTELSWYRNGEAFIVFHEAHAGSFVRLVDDQGGVRGECNLDGQQQ